MSARLGVDIEPVSSAEIAVEGCDIVVTATNTGRGGDVAYRGEWLTEGQHIASIGSTAPFLREIDELAISRPDVVVFDAQPTQVAAESGDVLAVLSVMPDWRPAGTLDDLLSGAVARRDPQQVTLFKSVGTAAQDLIAALAIVRLAETRGVGLVVPDLNEPKPF
jgi:ornithine cyclodeaminase/alanine dehydrogenase-like protein (mu-crystallin family)